jgi:predicted NUDIX family NTP pyrophosphohydrolase
MEAAPGMAKISAGILLFRRRGDAVEVFLVHPGGPYWARKDDGAWSIPKGEVEAGEDHLTRAKLEFAEETGSTVEGSFAPLERVTQAGGKIVHAWAVEGDTDAATIRSNTFSLEWPPGSGKAREFPEVDRAEWFCLPAAREKIISGQRPLLEQLEGLIGG